MPFWAFFFHDFDVGLCTTFSTVGGAIPGQCLSYKAPGRKLDILLRLPAIFPASFLVSLQCFPAIKHEDNMIHRIYKTAEPLLFADDVKRLLFITCIRPCVDSVLDRS